MAYVDADVSALLFYDDGCRECRSLATVFRLVCLTTYFAIDVRQRHVYRITLIDDGGVLS